VTWLKKAIESAEPDQYTLQQPRPAPVLGAYLSRIDELLAENERLRANSDTTGHKIYEQLQKEGYTGSESGIRRHIGQRRREGRKRPVYIPLEFDPGMDGQVDWAEAEASSREQLTVHLFLMRLCYSRKLFVCAFPGEKQEAFFEGHKLAFHHFGGIHTAELR